MIWNIWIEIAGLILGLLLFYRRLELKAAPAVQADNSKLSVIIPARNEAANLPILLESLRIQTSLPDEIICVDDGSSDGTAAIATAFGAKVITIAEKPAGWVGKSWACQQGAELATGDLLLFVDADVSLDPDAIARLLATYADGKGVISVQPFHRIQRLYENISYFFNLIQIAANGICLPFKHKKTGLFGPVILIAARDYEAIDGHQSVQRCVIEDVALGHSLTAKEINYRLFIGGLTISYRMYSNGLRELYQGWVKNIAAGAIKTPPGLLAMVLVWVTGCTAVVVDLVIAAFANDTAGLLQAGVVYVLIVAQLIWATRLAGNFSLPAIVAFPLWLLGFIFIFLLSLIYKLLGIHVMWKGRKVTPCK